MKQESELYRRALADATAHHAASKTYSGKLLRPHKPYISDLIASLEIASAIDVGCGKCEQYRWIDPVDGKTMEAAWGFEVAKFDPACPPYDVEPIGQFDLVICTHTLGSIPLDDMEWFIDGLFARARKAVFIAEKIGTIKKDVHGARDGFANGWSRLDWFNKIAARKYGAHPIGSPMDEIEIHLSTTETIAGEKITERAVML